MSPLLCHGIILQPSLRARPRARYHIYGVCIVRRGHWHDCVAQTSRLCLRRIVQCNLLDESLCQNLHFLLAATCTLFVHNHCVNSCRVGCEMKYHYAIATRDGWQSDRILTAIGLYLTVPMILRTSHRVNNMRDRYLRINHEIQCIDQTIAAKDIPNGIMIYN